LKYLSAVKVRTSKLIPGMFLSDSERIIIACMAYWNLEIEWESDSFIEPEESTRIETSYPDIRPGIVVVYSRGVGEEINRCALRELKLP